MESSSEEEKFCYPSSSSSSAAMMNHHHQIHTSGFQSTPPSSEMFNIENEMIGFSKPHSSSIWKPFFPKDGAGTSGSPKHADESTAGDQFYQFNPAAGIINSVNTTRMMMTVEDEEEEDHPRSSRGLSLSLSSTIGLQHQQQQQMVMENSSLYEQQQFELRRSRYLGAAQELLNEFCSMGNKQIDNPRPKSKQLDDNNEDVVDDAAAGRGSTSSSTSNINKPSVGSLEFLELQKRKTKLYSLLEEVDRKYRHYCEQMKAVVSSFEAVAGDGAATVYSALASKAMSRHFRCLRDGIVTQIQATRKSMGEKDPVAPGTTRGETPRLKVIDQRIRQRRAFQQMNLMETHPWRPQRGLPERSVSVLRAWLFEHFLHPYPSDVDKHILARQTGLSRSQASLSFLQHLFLCYKVSNWFINARVRLWKPMVEELYIEEAKEQEDNILNNNNNNSNSLMLTSSDGDVPTFDDHHDNDEDHDNNMNIRLLSSNLSSSDQKPTQEQLIRIDSDCLSSIISNPDHMITNRTTIHHQHQHHMAPNQGFGAFGAVEFDHFSSYHPSGAPGVSYSHHHHHHHQQQQQQSGGVSLTLGLQQHGSGGSGGVSLAFTPASHSSNLFYPRDQIEQQQQQQVHQYSLLDGDQGQNLPYRNLMGAQLLHDFAG
ncbi:Homeobox protein BEL1 homolog [Linum perenne]